MSDRIPYSKEETLKSYDAAIELFEKQIADIRAGITLLKKLRELSAGKSDD